MKGSENFLIRYWKQIHILQKIGITGVLLSSAASFYVIHATPAALWNGPRHHAEEYALLTARGVSVLLLLIGQFIRLRQEEAAGAGQNEG